MKGLGARIALRSAVWLFRTAFISIDSITTPSALVTRGPALCSHCRISLLIRAADIPVHFVLLAPMTGTWAVGLQSAGAAELAIETVNADKTLLPVLEYSWRDSGCSEKQGLAVMGDMLENDDKISAVIILLLCFFALAASRAKISHCARAHTCMCQCKFHQQR